MEVIGTFKLDFGSGLLHSFTMSLTSHGFGATFFSCRSFYFGLGIEFHLNNVLLNLVLIDSWSGFFAIVVY